MALEERLPQRDRPQPDVLRGHPRRRFLRSRPRVSRRIPGARAARGSARIRRATVSPHRTRLGGNCCHDHLPPADRTRGGTGSAHDRRNATTRYQPAPVNRDVGMCDDVQPVRNASRNTDCRRRSPLSSRRREGASAATCRRGLFEGFKFEKTHFAFRRATSATTSKCSTSLQVSAVLFVLRAHSLEDVAVWNQVKRQFHRERAGVVLRIVDRDLDVHVPEVAAMIALR